MGGSDSVAWDPSHFHGTSLQDYAPSSNMVSEFHQVGLACVTLLEMGRHRSMGFKLIVPVREKRRECGHLRKWHRG